MGEKPKRNVVEDTKKLQRENEELKERLYQEEQQKEKERRGLFLTIITILGICFAFNFIVPYILGLHQSGYFFVKRVIERKNIKKALGTTAEEHILLDADVWEKEYIGQLEEMGFSIVERTTERNNMVMDRGIYGERYDEEISRYDLADGKGRICVTKDVKGNDLIAVDFFETGEHSRKLIFLALREIADQQGYSITEEEMEKWMDGIIPEQVAVKNYRNFQIMFSRLEGYPSGELYTIKGEKDTSVMSPIQK